MIFKKKSTNMRLCNENKAKLEDLFHSKVVSAKRYELVYGTSMMMKDSESHLLEPTSPYMHLVIGFNEEDLCFVLLQTNYSTSACGEPHMHSWENLKNAKIVGGQFTLYHDDATTSEVTQISVQGFPDEKGIIYMNQREEASKWDSFWIRFLTSK